MAETCDKGVIMYAGEVVESGTVAHLFNNPTHPYTRQLIKAFPNIHERREMVSSIQGDPPNLLDPPPGCGFSPRCSVKTGLCTQDPGTVEVEPGHFVRCHLAKRGV
jgi:oligopeptide/dipeptide ABC transporter ATP-binding protein